MREVTKLKYPYIVKKNDVLYPSGADVPEGAIELVENVSFTKTEIQRKSLAELREIAAKENIEGFEDMTGSNLKKLLIKKFDL